MTLTQLTSHVRVEIGETTAGFWTDAQLYEYISRSAQDFSVETGILTAPPVETDSVADSGLYTLPGSCPGPHAVIRVYYDGNLIEPSTVNALIRNVNAPHSDSGTPLYWYMLTKDGLTYLGLCPIPGSAVTDGIVLYYWKMSDRMTGGTDVCDIPDEFYRAVVYRATQFAFGSQGEKTKYEIYEGLYKEEVLRAQDYVNVMIAASLHDRDVRETGYEPLF